MRPRRWRRRRTWGGRGDAVSTIEMRIHRGGGETRRGGCFWPPAASGTERRGEGSPSLLPSFPVSVVGNEKGGSLNTVNHDVGSDNVRNTVDTRDIISRVQILSSL